MLMTLQYGITYVAELHIVARSFVGDLLAEYRSGENYELEDEQEIESKSVDAAAEGTYPADEGTYPAYRRYHPTHGLKRLVNSPTGRHQP
jgi:hypothetical protein